MAYSLITQHPLHHACNCIQKSTHNKLNVSSSTNRTGPSAPSTGPAQSTGPGSALTGKLREAFDAAQLTEEEKRDRKSSWPAGHAMAPSGTRDQVGGYGSKKSTSTAGKMSQFDGGGAA